MHTTNRLFDATHSSGGHTRLVFLGIEGYQDLQFVAVDATNKVQKSGMLSNERKGVTHKV